MKKEIFIHSVIKTEDENAIKKICEITGESKTKVIRRLIQNEFHLLTNKPELIANKLEDITERRFQRLFDKLNELQEDIGENHKEIQTNQNLLKKINAISRKIFGGLLICNRDVHRNYFIISRTLFENFKMAKEKIDTYVNRSIVNTGHAMRSTIKQLDWELKRITDSFEDMGKDIKTEDLK